MTAVSSEDKVWDMSNRTQAEADAAEQAAFARGDAEETQRAIAALTAAVAALTAEVRELRVRTTVSHNASGEAMSPEAIAREHAGWDRMFAAGYKAAREHAAERLEHAAERWRTAPLFDLADVSHPVAVVLEAHAMALRPVTP